MYKKRFQSRVDTKIKNRLQTVFSLADSELDTFIKSMATNNNDYPSETYFKDILDKLTSPISLYLGVLS